MSEQSKARDYLQKRLKMLSDKKVILNAKISKINTDIENIDEMIKQVSKEVDNAFEIFSPRQKKNDFARLEIDKLLSNKQELKDSLTLLTEEANELDGDIGNIKEALGETVIIYDRTLYEQAPTARELCIKHSQDAQWVQFVALFLVGSEADEPLVGDKQLIIPADLVHAWQQATVFGEPLLASEPTVLVAGEPQTSNTWFTPMVLAVLLLVLSIINLWVKYPYFDWLMLAAQTLVGCFMTYLICFSDLCCTDWNWLLIPFNPLPLIFWHWRKYWALPYAGVLAVWNLAMAAVAIWGHVLVDWSHIVMVIAWIIIVIKQYILNKFINI